MWFLHRGIGFEDVLMRLLASFFIIFLVLPLHEYAHGWVAYKLGDSTAKYSGRMSLNPLVHIDPLGALGILLFGFGWAKPVPVDASNFKNPKTDMALTALAGPASNLIAATAGGLLFNALVLAQGLIPAALLRLLLKFFVYYISINVGIAVFNLIPLPSLDGFKIVSAFIPDRLLYKYAPHQGAIMLVVFVLLFTGILSWPLSLLQAAFYRGVMWLSSLPFLFFR